MTFAATPQYQTNNPIEMNSSQISPEDMEKLQEIHELINLLFTELTARSPQGAPMPYTTTGPLPMMPAMASAPYTQSLFHYAWGMTPYLRTPVF
jgi:hypothetical protein